MPATLGYVIATPTELPLQMGGPSPALPNGREFIGAPPHPSPRGWSSYLLCFRRFEWLLPLGEGWDGASMLAAESPSPVSLFGETGEGLVVAFSLPLGGH